MMSSKLALSQFLSSFRKPANSSEPFEHTHTRIGDKTLHLAGGSYSIPDDRAQDFVAAYKSHVFDKTPRLAKTDGSHLLPTTNEYLTERQAMDAGPIMIDLDFRYATNITTRQHDANHIEDLVDLYPNSLNKILDLTHFLATKDIMCSCSRGWSNHCHPSTHLDEHVETIS